MTTQSFVAGGAAAGRPRPRHALHRHVLRAAVAVDRPALRHRLRGGHLRRQGAQQRRQRLGRADPRRHQLGGRPTAATCSRCRSAPTCMQAHPPYSAAGARALQKGSLIIAAAGNNADRRAGNVGFVGAPANSPEIMAVGALEQQAGHGVLLRPQPAGPRRAGRHRRPRATRCSRPGRCRPGTGRSAAPAWPRRTSPGVAALWAEATGRRGLELWATLCLESQRLLQPSVDVGSGLCIAPQ